MTDLEFIKDQNMWPAWPLLPLKRYKDGNYETAVLRATEPLTLAENVNMWSYHPDTASSIPVTADEVLARGWKID